VAVEPILRTLQLLDFPEVARVLALILRDARTKNPGAPGRAIAPSGLGVEASSQGTSPKHLGDATFDQGQRLTYHPPVKAFCMTAKSRRSTDPSAVNSAGSHPAVIPPPGPRKHARKVA